MAAARRRVWQSIKRRNQWRAVARHKRSKRRNGVMAVAYGEKIISISAGAARQQARIKMAAALYAATSKANISGIGGVEDGGNRRRRNIIGRKISKRTGGVKRII